MAWPERSCQVIGSGAIVVSLPDTGTVTGPPTSPINNIHNGQAIRETEGYESQGVPVSTLRDETHGFL